MVDDGIEAFDVGLDRLRRQRIADVDVRRPLAVGRGRPVLEVDGRVSAVRVDEAVEICGIDRDVRR